MPLTEDDSHEAPAVGGTLEVSQHGETDRARMDATSFWAAEQIPSRLDSAAPKGDMPIVKRSLYLLVAFGMGAILMYGAVRLYPPVRPDSQEWGVIVTTLGECASLWGLFDSKAECLDARKAFIEEYGVAAGRFLDKKGSKSMLLKHPSGMRVMLTFSCLPLSEIR